MTFPFFAYVSGDWSYYPTLLKHKSSAEPPPPAEEPDQQSTTLRIKPQLDECDGLVEFQLTGPEHAIIKRVSEDFEIFNMITTEIQAKRVDLIHVRLQFNTICADIPCLCMQAYLNLVADIVRSKAFENGVRNLLLPNHANLTDDETEALERRMDPKKQAAQEEAQQLQKLSLKDKLALNIKKRKLGAGLPDDGAFASLSVHVEVGKLISVYVEVGKLIWCATSDCVNVSLVKPTIFPCQSRIPRPMHFYRGL